MFVIVLMTNKGHPRSAQLSTISTNKEECQNIPLDLMEVKEEMGPSGAAQLDLAVDVFRRHPEL